MAKVPETKAYVDGYFAGSNNTPWRKANGFRQTRAGDATEASVRSAYLDGYLRGYAEAQVAAAVNFNRKPKRTP